MNLRRNSSLQGNWRLWLRPIRIVAAVIVLLVGLAGLLVPILPGWVLIFVGVVLLGTDNCVGRWLHARMHALRQRFHRPRRAKCSPPPTSRPTT